MKPQQSRHPRPRGVTASVTARLAWRDAMLDQLATILANHRDLADQGRRAARYLESARALEQAADMPRGTARLAEWTQERLPELARKRPESALRPVRLMQGTLAAHFRSWQPFARTRERHRACVRLAEGLIARAVRAGRLPGPVRRLTPTQRNEVAFTEAGHHRAPKAMAWRLLYLALPTNQDPESFRSQLEHVRLRPPAL